ncbi:MAG TPA: hypothetical protein EYN66_06460, partial [Myxococcales bacterium]|nr:hypothetical protein [Myxococcales bacterium]
MGAAGTNLIRYSRFAHRKPIIDIVFSPNGKALVSTAEDRTVKIWETRTFTQQRVLETQPDWASALAVAPDNATLLVGRLDGSLKTYPIQTTGEAGSDKAVPLPEEPVAEPHPPTARADVVQVEEVEPNDQIGSAMPLQTPGAVSGVLWPASGASPDRDLYRFVSKAGTTWIMETNAARSKSPADTRIEVLYSDGKPVPRLLLRAVRDSYITFRPIDSTQTQVRLKNWEEMRLNQFLYMRGELGKFLRLPQGPDSGMLFYSVNGKRKCYFDTSATVHAKDELVYIVEPYLPTARLTDNGLPVFPVYYANDDDGDRKHGSDSRLMFTAPTDGSYLVRVTDIRGFGGSTYKYSLMIRDPKPDFNVSIGGKGAKVGVGSGVRLTFTLDRIDAFDGEVR